MLTTVCRVVQLKSCLCDAHSYHNQRRVCVVVSRKGNRLKLPAKLAAARSIRRIAIKPFVVVAFISFDLTLGLTILESQRRCFGFLAKCVLAKPVAAAREPVISLSPFLLSSYPSLVSINCQRHCRQAPITLWYRRHN